MEMNPLIYFLFVSGVSCATQAEIDQHLNLGMTLLAKGQYSDALSHFHSAVGKSLTQLITHLADNSVTLSLSQPQVEGIRRLLLSQLMVAQEQSSRPPFNKSWY